MEDKVFGAFLLVAIGIIVFGMVVETLGLRAALSVIVTAFLLTSVAFLGVYLLTR